MKKYAYQLTILLLLVYSNVNACYVWLTDGSGDDLGKVITVYPNLNTGIFITGCTYSHPFAASRIYIISNSGVDEDGLNTTTLVDAGGNPNVINSFISCGYVQDELIGSTAQLPVGEYDVVFDKNNNGKFEKGIDCLLNPGSDFTFKLIPFQPASLNSPLPPVFADGAESFVNTVKQRAAQTRDKLKVIYDKYKTAQLALSLFDALKGAGVGTIANIAKGTALRSLVGGVIGGAITNSQTSLDYFTQSPLSTTAQGAADQAAQAAIARYDAIAKDPPRFDYTTLAVIDSVDLDFDFQYNDSADIFFTKLYTLMQVESRTLSAELISLERMQGALIDSNSLGVYVQSRNLLGLTRLRSSLHNLKIQNWNYLKSAIAAKGRASDTIATGNLNLFQQRILNQGFSDEHKMTFESKSLSNDEVAQLRTQLIDANFSNLTGKTLSQLIDESIAAEDSFRIAANTQADSLLELSNRFGSSLNINPLLADFEITGPSQILGRNHTANGEPAIAAQLVIGGTPSPVIAPKIIYYRSGLVFNNQNSASPVLNEPGFELVRLEVNTTNGLKGFAYKMIEVTPGIVSPKIISVQPDSFFIKPLNQDSPIVFKVLSATTPNGFQPKYEWFINGIPYAKDVDSLSFRPLSCSKNIFEVRVILKDTALGNFDFVRDWQIKVNDNPALCNNKPERRNATHWYFGNQAAIKFGGPQPVALTNSAMTQFEGVATMSDSAGNLLFYTQGITVYNRNHVVMQNGSGLTSHNSNTQAAMIIPYPGKPYQYLIVTPDPYYYSVVDMTLDNGNGAIISTQKNILIGKTGSSDRSEKVTAVYAANQRDIWLITCASSNKYFESFLVTENGISPQPVKSDFGNMGLSLFSGYFGYMKASPSGKNLVTADFANSIHLYDFDNRSGVVSNLRRIPLTLGGLGSYGIEFSPDGKLIYVADHRGPNRITQLDITLDSIQQMVDSIVTLGASPVALGALQLGPDGKIYVAKENGFLGVINQPNRKGATNCDYVVDGVFLNGKTSSLGLPGFISSILVSNDIKYTSECAESPTQFELERDLSSIDSVFWNFGDSQSANNTALGKNAEHIYADAGIYTVQCVIRYDTINGVFYDTIYTDVDVKAISYSNTELLYFDPNPTCNDSIMLAPTNFGDSYQWFKDGQEIPGANTMSIFATQSGVYAVQIGSINGCAKPATDSVGLVFLDGNVNPTITQNGLQLETQAFSSYQWYRNDTLLQGQTAQTVSLTSAGNYHVVVKNADGCEGESNKILYQPVVIGIEETESARFSFYPNPVRDVLFIQSEDKTTPVILTDVNGHAVMRVTEASVNVSNLPAGLYFITQGNSRARFVKY